MPLCLLLGFQGADGLVGKIQPEAECASRARRGPGCPRGSWGGRRWEEAACPAGRAHPAACPHHARGAGLALSPPLSTGFRARRFSSLRRALALTLQLDFLSVPWSAVPSCLSLVSHHHASRDGRKKPGESFHTCL